MKKRLRVLLLVAMVCVLTAGAGMNGMQTACAGSFFDFLFGRKSQETEMEPVKAVVTAFGEEELSFESLLPQEDAETPVHSLEMSSVPEVSYYVYTAEVPGAFELSVTGLDDGVVSVFHASEDALMPTAVDESGRLIARMYLEVGDVVYIRLTHSEKQEKKAANISIAWLSYLKTDAVMDMPVPKEEDVAETDDDFEALVPKATPTPPKVAATPTATPRPTPPKTVETPSPTPKATPTPTPTPKSTATPTATPRPTPTPTCEPKPEVIRPTPTVAPLPSCEPLPEIAPTLIPTPTPGPISPTKRPTACPELPEVETPPAATPTPGPISPTRRPQ